MSSVAALRVSFLVAATVLGTAAWAPSRASAQQSTPQPSSTAPPSIPADVTNKLASDLAKLQAEEVKLLST